MQRRYLAIAPERSTEQRDAALAVANEVRHFRADMKRDLRAFRVMPADLLAEPDGRLCSMHVIDLLLAIPGIGASKAQTMLSMNAISPRKTIGGMTPRQRAKVIDAIDWHIHTSKRFQDHFEVAA